MGGLAPPPACFGFVLMMNKKRAAKRSALANQATVLHEYFTGWCLYIACMASPSGASRYSSYTIQRAKHDRRGPSLFARFFSHAEQLSHI